MKIINVCGYEIAVEAKSASQLAYIKKQLEHRPAQTLAAYAKETKKMLARKESK